MQRYFIQGEAAAFLLFFIGCFLLRWFFAAERASSWDEVDFALALERYDILQMQPHFPGYPLFILAGMLLRIVIGHPVLSLSLVSAIFGSLSILLIFALMKTIARQWRPEQASRWAWAGAIVYAVHPAVTLSHLQPMSEALGVFMLLLYLWTVSLVLGQSGRHPYPIALAAAAIYALMLGVRLSYFPFAFVMLLPLWKMLSVRTGSLRKLFMQWLSVIAVGAAVVALWLFPTANTEGGIQAYWQLGKQFTAGHFTQWGGTVWDAPSGTFAMNILKWLGAQWLGVGVTGSYMGDSSTAAILLSAVMLASLASLEVYIALTRTKRTLRTHSGVELDARRKPSLEVILFVALGAVPYFFWNLIGQNMEKWRHLLPLYPFLFMLIAALLVRSWRRGLLWLRMMVFVYAFALTAQMFLLLHDFSQPQPVHKMSNAVSNYYFRGNILVYTWEEKRILDYYNSQAETIRLQSYDVFLASLREQADAYDTIMITNSVVNGFIRRNEGEPLLPYLKELNRWRGSRLIDPVYYDLVLYEVDKDKIKAFGYND
jgi:hypothetical protein